MPTVAHSVEHAAWKSMIRAAYHPTDCNYAKVGAKGITVHRRWRDSFTEFRADMGDCPAGKRLKRHDKSKSFYLSNCYWG